MQKLCKNTCVFANKYFVPQEAREVCETTGLQVAEFLHKTWITVKHSWMENILLMPWSMQFDTISFMLIIPIVLLIYIALLVKYSVNLHSFISEISMKDANINLNIIMWKELCKQAKNDVLKMFLVCQMENIES